MLSGIDALIHSTVRIETKTTDGLRGSGTGFFFNLFSDGNFGVPVIVTNKHVVADAATGLFYISVCEEDGAPKYGQHERIKIDNFKSYWLPHPQSDVDLSIFMIGPLLNDMAARGKKPFLQILPSQFVANESIIETLSAMEDIIMVGYPNGIWDAKNNIPIIRRGVTATPMSIDYEGRTEFVIDCACFPGSSGSPVYLYSNGAYRTKEGAMIMGGLRISLLGILYAGPQHTAQGELIIQSVPTAIRQVPISRIPNNLGYVIKSKRLLDFEDAVVKAGLLDLEQIATARKRAEAIDTAVQEAKNHLS